MLLFLLQNNRNAINIPSPALVPSTDQPAAPSSASCRPLLRQIVATLPEDLPGLRDKALLLVGFAGAFWRSELIRLQIRNIRIGDAGLGETCSGGN